MGRVPTSAKLVMAAVLLLAVLAGSVPAAHAQITVTTESAMTFDNTDFIKLQATVNGGGDGGSPRTAIATKQTVYVLVPDEEDNCKPRVDQVVPLPPQLQDANAVILVPEREQMRMYYFPNGHPDEGQMWVHPYSHGGWEHDEENSWVAMEGWIPGAWTDIRTVEQEGPDGATYVVLTQATRLLVFVVRSDPSSSGEWDSWDWTADLDWTDDPTTGIAPTGSAYMFGGVRASLKTGASALILQTTESSGPQRGYVHTQSSFYTTPPQLVLANGDEAWPRAFREFWWFQMTKEGDASVLHWIGEDGRWFGPNADDSLRTAQVDVASGGTWGRGGAFFTESKGEYSAAAVALAVSGTKTTSRVHVFQFVGNGDAYDIAQVATHDLTTPLIEQVIEWPAPQCKTAVLVGARSASGRAQPTVVALHGVGTRSAAEVFAEHGAGRLAEEMAKRFAARPGPHSDTSPLGADTGWCYADEQCVCPDSARSQAPCGPSLCCEAYGSMCWQVGTDAAALTTNCCPAPPVAGCTSVRTPCS